MSIVYGFSFTKRIRESSWMLAEARESSRKLLEPRVRIKFEQVNIGRCRTPEKLRFFFGFHQPLNYKSSVPDVML